MASCPICGKPAPSGVPGVSPFCSARCKQIDLGQWLDEKYRVPTGDPPEGDAGEGEKT